MDFTISEVKLNWKSNRKPCRILDCYHTESIDTNEIATHSAITTTGAA